ncbi:MAG: HEAT repeat domain-containing protein [Myxococcota bacterium]|nr:HEAT repeat domain-containing protein [Myxococcota bacterium]
MSFLIPLEMPTIAAALRDARSASAEARWVAAMALGTADHGHWEAAAAALRELLQDPVDGVRAQALEGLLEQMRSGQPLSADIITAALADTAPSVRCVAVDALIMTSACPAQDLAPYLGDPDPSVRAAAASGLGSLRAIEASDRIAVLLKDTDGYVTDRAAMALAELGDPRGEAVLCQALSADAATACEAARALGELGRPSSLPALEKAQERRLLSTEAKAMIAAAAVRCSGNQPHHRGLSVLKELLGSIWQSKRLAALSTLVRLPVVGIAAHVARLMDQGREIEASAAIETLVAISTIDADAATAELERRIGKLSPPLDQELNATLTQWGAGP